MNNFNSFTKIDLQRKDIHTLRNLARSIGVAQPTSKKKAVLISDIMSVITGKQEPEYKNANRGRPAKYSDYFYPQGTMSFSMSMASKGPAYETDAVRSGVVVLNTNGAMIKKLRFVDSAGDLQISQEDVKNFALKDNDIVEYEICNNKIAITKVNDKLTNLKNDKICGKKIVFGATNLIKVDLHIEKEKIISELKEKIIVIPESNLEMFESKNIVILPVSKIDDKEILNNFFASISMASFYQKSGENTVLVMSNYLNLASSMQNVMISGINHQVEDYLKRFVDAGGTFIAFAPSIFEKTDGIKFDNVD